MLADLKIEKDNFTIINEIDNKEYIIKYFK
jgi:hypothetical protein